MAAGGSTTRTPSAEPEGVASRRALVASARATLAVHAEANVVLSRRPSSAMSVVAGKRATGHSSKLATTFTSDGGAQAARPGRDRGPALPLAARALLLG